MLEFCGGEVAKRLRDRLGNSLLGCRNHYDDSNGNAGYTIDGLLGESHYDRHGKKVGYSTDSLFGESTVLFEDNDNYDDDW
jgi:hypothetical protein